MRTTCLVCKKPLPEIAIAAQDPYCSAKCCKQAHNVQTTTIRGPVLPQDVGKGVHGYRAEYLRLAK